MAASAELRVALLSRVPVSLRRAPLWFGSSLGLIAALTLYCELCGVVHGQPAPGLEISVPWALRVSFGWILAGAALGAFGRRVLHSGFASRYPRALMLVSIAAIAACTLACEVIARGLNEDAASLLSFVYARAAVHALASALLVAIYAAPSILEMRLSSISAAGAAASSKDERRGAASLPGPAAASDAAGLMEVMTGTGRTTIRVEDIECLQADGNYVNVFLESGRHYLLRQTMAATERSLDPRAFARVHRSTIINRAMVKERRPGGVLILQSGRAVRVSRSFGKRLE